jgi:hypothetical protein
MGEKALVKVNVDLEAKRAKGPGYSKRVPQQDRGTHRACQALPHQALLERRGETWVTVMGRDWVRSMWLLMGLSWADGWATSRAMRTEAGSSQARLLWGCCWVSAHLSPIQI